MKSAVILSLSVPELADKVNNLVLKTAFVIFTTFSTKIKRNNRHKKFTYNRYLQV